MGFIWKVCSGTPEPFVDPENPVPKVAKGYGPSPFTGLAPSHVRSDFRYLVEVEVKFHSSVPLTNLRSIISAISDLCPDWKGTAGQDLIL